MGMEGKRSADFHGDEVLGCGAVDVFGLSKKGREDVFIKTSLSHHKHLSLLLSASLSFSHPLLEINKLIKKARGKGHDVSLAPKTVSDVTALPDLCCHSGWSVLCEDFSSEFNRSKNNKAG